MGLYTIKVNIMIFCNDKKSSMVFLLRSMSVLLLLFCNKKILMHCIYCLLQNVSRNVKLSIWYLLTLHLSYPLSFLLIRCSLWLFQWFFFISSDFYYTFSFSWLFLIISFHLTFTGFFFVLLWFIWKIWMISFVLKLGAILHFWRPLDRFQFECPPDIFRLF